MTHAEIVKEFREIRDYLQGKATSLKAKYGDKPEFANEYDEWHYEILMQVCATIQEHECKAIPPYLEVQVPDLQYAHPGYGIKI